MGVTDHYFHYHAESSKARQLTRSDERTTIATRLEESIDMGACDTECDRATEPTTQEKLEVGAGIETL